MPDPSLADLKAEREWRLARTITDPDEQAANERRIAELDRLIAEAASPQPPTASDQPIVATTWFAVIVLIVVVAILLLIVAG